MKLWAVPIVFCGFLSAQVFNMVSATKQVTNCDYLNQQIASEMTELL